MEYIISERSNGEPITVREVQLKLLEILKEFDRVCVKHNIEYILAFGSALGAVRHQGFIPWDDDLDISMDYSNYKKLLRVLSTELKNDFYYHCFDVDNRYNVTLPAMKIKIKNSYIKEKTTLLKNKCEGDGLFLDVFIYDSVSESRLKENISRIPNILRLPVISLLEYLNINPLYIKKRYVKNSIKNIEKNKDSKYISLTTTWTFNLFKDFRIKKDDLHPIKRISFEGGMYPVVNNTHNYLTALYGSTYNELPAKRYQSPKHIEELELE